MPSQKQTTGKSTLTTAEQVQIVDQALVLIEQVYVHLPLKRAMHAVEPIQRLRLLKQRLSGISERSFHNEMISIFAHLRDLHTNYILPEPFRDRVAFLPFRIQVFYEGDERQYVVTQVKPGAVERNSGNKDFKQGVLITHWNGIPIDRAVEINAEREAGSNLEARRARGLEAMTIRPMALSLPPDEEWVVISYKVKPTSSTREIRFNWKVMVLDKSLEGIDPLSATGEAARILGIDAKSDLERRGRKKLFAPDTIAVEKTIASNRNTAKSSVSVARPKRKAKATVSFDFVSLMPRVFTFRKIKNKHGSFAYIRIHTFNEQSHEQFVNEFVRIAGLLPQNGLILDVRGNGGGNIIAGERLLQVLTPRRIDPERLHFINTALTLRLCRQNDFIHQWIPSIAQAVETGATYSQGFPLLPLDSYNDIGQKYQGPVVLLIDALCYSTTDIFTAGFQDHEIGVVLGTSANTGAGGANVWDLDLLKQCLPAVDSPFRAMPRNASFRVAIRHTTRVGPHSGVLVEDLGITPNKVHKTTKQDVLKNDVDLLNRASEILSKRPVYSLTAQLQQTATKPSAVIAKTKKVSRIDAALDGRPYKSVDVQGDKASIDLPSLSPGPHQLELQGFFEGKLKVSTRLAF